ncbi:FG-GAP-like repeat-containing protein [Streptomyces sp. NPDC020898]|uniref:FG-GAP-like repeat-containing protein n=1 Tax=Streptomyces sp. NPDC020898 TaxID=3365101 RepID=UPI0037AE5AA3
MKNPWGTWGPAAIGTPAALAALLLSGLTPLTLATPAAAAPSRLSGDFNGDGFRDVAIAAPAATVSGLEWAGQVAVVNGTAKGLDPARRKLISQNTPGVPGAAEEGDEFGSQLAVADLDRDGYSDLVIGTPWEKMGNSPDAGTVTVVWGSKNGLTGGTTIQNPHPTPGGTYFGLSIAAADFTGDGKPDLAVSAQGDTGTASWRIRLISGPFGRTGKTGKISSYDPGIDKPALTAGRVSGDARADLVVTGQKPNQDRLATAVYYRGTATGLTRAAALRPAVTATIGDLNKDGYGDIVLGNPMDRDNEPTAVLGGKIDVVYGTGAGPSPSRRVAYTQNTAGVPDTAEYGDGFGTALAIADFNRDGYGDLVIGARGESFGTDYEPIGGGAITLLRGSRAGLTTSGTLQLTQDSAGVPGGSEFGDGFGARLLASDVTHDGRPDLTVMAVGENDGAGAAWFFPGAAAQGSTTFGPTAVGLPSAQGASFGSDLAG